MTCTDRVNPIETQFAAAVLRAQRLESGRPATVAKSMNSIICRMRSNPGADTGQVAKHLLLLTKSILGEYSEPNPRQLIKQSTLILFVLLNTTVIILLFFGGNFDRLAVNERMSPDMLQLIQAIEGKILIPTLIMPPVIAACARAASPTVNLVSKRVIWRDSR